MRRAWPRAGQEAFRDGADRAHAETIQQTLRSSLEAT